MNAPKGRSHKKCIFCGSGNVSKEHFYSAWMADLLDGGDEGHGVATIISHPIKGTETKDRQRPASILTKKVRAPCDRCNSTWMNQTEAKARPFLTAMMAGEPISLDLHAQLAVGKWIAMKVMVAEHADQEIAVTPVEEKRRFKETGQIPSYFRIYIGTHRSTADVGYIRMSSTASLPELSGPVPPLNGMRRNVQQVSFLLGRLFIHVNAARIDGFTIEDRVKIPVVHDETRLWPVSRVRFNWPEAPALSNDDLYVISHSWESVTKSEHVVWGGDLPEEQVP